MKYLESNVTKYVQELYTKNYKLLLKEIKDLCKWNGILCLWYWKTQIVEMVVSMLHRFDAI